MLKRQQDKPTEVESTQTGVISDFQAYVQQQIKNRIDQLLKSIYQSLPDESIQRITEGGKTISMFTEKGPSREYSETSLLGEPTPKVL